MNSSHPKTPMPISGESLSNPEQELRRLSPESLLPNLNDENSLREVLNASIKSCGKSRDQICDDMSILLQTRVTRRALDLYTAESAEQNRFPMQYARAFCRATGNDALLRLLPELAGLRIIGDEEQALLDLGREFLRQKRAAAKIAGLEDKLSGVDLG